MRTVRLRVWIGAVVPVLAAALWLAPTAAVAETDHVMRRLSLGADVGSIGTVPPSVDAEGSGPSALFAAADGRVYLLDQVNGRILAMDGGGDAPAQSLRLPEDLVPQDLVAVGDRLFVWDGRVHALGAADAPGSPVLEARAVSSVDDATRSVFAQMGSQTPSSEDEVVGAAGRAASSDELGAPIRQFVASRGAGPVDIEIVTAADARSALIELRPQSAPLDLRRLRVKVSGRLGAIEVLDIVDGGDAFVFTENIPRKATDKASAFVARFDVRGRLRAIYDLPITADQFPTRRFVTVTPQGRVLYLKSDETGVAILDLSRRSPGGKAEFDAPSRRSAAAPAPAGLEEPIITAIRPGTRLGAIRTGLAFEGLKWAVTPKNYGPDPDRACLGFEGRTRRPAYLDRKLGQEVRGVAYCWGCFGSFVDFKRRVDAGVLAGNWCTREEPRRDTAGVDCSAFVSQCWGLSRQLTTSDIPGITEPLADPWDLKPGDALNKPGSHVMLFVKFTPDRKVEVLEASAGGCNGRVCRNVYPLSVLLARGYRPVRYTALKDQ